MGTQDQPERKWLREFLILPLMVGIIVAAVTFGLPRLFRDAKELSYVIDRPVVFLDDPAIEHVKVEVNDVAVSFLVAYKVRIWNSGDVPLKALPISFVFEGEAEGFQVFSTSHLTNPQYEFGRIDEKELDDATGSRFVYELLNPGDQDIVTLLTNSRADLKVFAKAEKLKVKSISPETEQYGWSRWASMIAVVIAGIASALTSIFRILFERKRK